MVHPAHPRALFAGLILILTACGGAATAGTNPGAVASTTQVPSPIPTASPSPVPTSTPTPIPPTSAPTPSAAPAAPGSAVNVRQTSLGQVLVDARGMTLYLFEADNGTTSACYSTCAQNWPPLHTKGTPVGGSGTMAALLGTTARKDGTAQVTYNGHPLYFFVGDSKPGDTHGEGINAFGGGWDVVSPAGAKIEGGN